MRISRLITITVLGASLILFYTAEATACGEACVTASNQAHVAEGRAELKNGDQGEGYYALGSGSFLGTDGSANTSVLSGDEALAEMNSYYRGYGYELVEIFKDGCGGNLYGVVYYDPCSGCCFICYIELEVNWARGMCDIDCDGIQDAWEADVYGHLGSSGGGDRDGDGVSDYVEYLAGTDPNDPNSVAEQGNYYVYDHLGRITNIARMD